MEAAAIVPDPRRWRALALVCVAFFMVVLDVAIVNVALPTIQQELEISRSTLQWIVTAYSLAFGGFLLLGGRAADLFGRRRVFRLISEGRVEGADRRVDPLSAIVVTAGLVSFVYAMSKAPDNGWTSWQTFVFTGAAVVLIGIFLWRELRTDAPLVPLWIFRLRPVTVANAVGALLGGAIFGGFFLLTLYMQQVLGYSPLKAGVAFLATAGTTIPAAALSQALVTRLGVKPVMTSGLLLMSFSYLWFTQLPPDGSFWTHLFIPYLASGFGLAFIFIPLSLAALTVVEDRITGISSGLLNTSQQIGGALGVAIMATISTTHSETLLEEGKSQAEAFTSGYNWAFWVAAGFMLLGAVITLAILRNRDVPTHEPEAVAEPAS